MTEVMIPAPMSPLEARDCINRVKDHWQAFWFELKRFHDEKGWVPLGYSSFKACVENELGFSEARAYQLLAAAEIQSALTQAGLSTDGLTSMHATVLQPLPPSVRVDVAQRVDFDETPVRELRAIVHEVRDAAIDGPADLDAAIERGREQYQARPRPNSQPPPPVTTTRAYAQDDPSDFDAAQDTYDDGVYVCDACDHRWPSSQGAACPECESRAQATAAFGAAPARLRHDWPEEEQETPEEKAYYVLARQRLIARYTPQAIADAALNPTGDLVGFEEFERWVVAFVKALRERAKHPLRVAK